MLSDHIHVLYALYPIKIYPSSLLLSPFLPPPPFLSLSPLQPPTQPNGVITNYIISYRLEDNPTSNQTTRIGSNATTFILKDLEKDKNYIVRVAAVNSIGVGPFSEISMAVTGSAGLREPQGPFYQTVWFIVVIIVVVVVVIVTLVLFVLIIKYKRSHRRSTGKYHGKSTNIHVYHAINLLV